MVQPSGALGSGCNVATVHAPEPELPLSAVSAQILHPGSSRRNPMVGDTTNEIGHLWYHFFPEIVLGKSTLETSLVKTHPSNVDVPRTVLVQMEVDKFEVLILSFKDLTIYGNVAVCVAPMHNR